MWHSHRYTCSTARAGRFARENRLYRKPANIPPAVREAPAFTPGRMSQQPGTHAPTKCVGDVVPMCPNGVASKHVVPTWGEAAGANPALGFSPLPSHWAKSSVDDGWVIVQA